MAIVLVIDDNADIRRVLTRILHSAGHEVLEAGNGIAGVDAVMEDHVDLVITDLFMPEQEGIETIRQIRDINAMLPIIAISGSGYDGPSPLHQAKQRGADLTIEKPFSVDVLLSNVEELLSRGRS